MSARAAAALVPFATLSACAMLPSDAGRPTLPDRGVAPWRVEPLELCIAAQCGDADDRIAGGVDIAWDGDHFVAVAVSATGGLLFGRIDPIPGSGPRGWRLWLDSAPLLLPTEPWHAGAFADPEVGVDRSGGGVAYTILFAVGNGSAIGFVNVSDPNQPLQSAQLLTATEIGAARIGEPSLLRLNGEVGVAFRSVAASDPRGEIAVAWGPTLETLAAPSVLLTAEEVETTGWEPVTALGGPDLGVASDGTLRLFFSAAVADLEEGTENRSIGYAAGSRGAALTPYVHNPVHDRTYSFILTADELTPSVAGDGGTMALVYVEARGGARRTTLAVHTLGQ